MALLVLFLASLWPAFFWALHAGCAYFGAWDWLITTTYAVAWLSTGAAGMFALVMLPFTTSRL